MMSSKVRASGLSYIYVVGRVARVYIVVIGTTRPVPPFGTDNCTDYRGPETGRKIEC